MFNKLIQINFWLDYGKCNKKKKLEKIDLKTELKRIVSVETGSSLRGPMHGHPASLKSVFTGFSLPVSTESGELFFFLV